MSEHNNCVHILSSQAFRSYLRNQYGHGIYPKFRKIQRVKIRLAKSYNYLSFLIKCKVHDIFRKGLTLRAP
jgi:hypothetical protein